MNVAYAKPLVRRAIAMAALALSLASCAENEDLGRDEKVNAPLAGVEAFDVPGAILLPFARRVRGAGGADHAGANDGCFTAAFYAPEAGAVLVLHVNRTDEAAFASLLSQSLMIITSTAELLGAITK